MHGPCFAIIADDRERGSGVLDALYARNDVAVRVQHLPVGDYLVDDGLLFERKTLADLAASVKDGRLFAQGLRLATSPWRPALILEGRSDALAACRLRREAIQGALITLSLSFGIPVLRARDAGETAALMLVAAGQARRHASGALPRPGGRPKGKRRVQHHVLQGLPGVGPERARRLLDHFGSIEAIIAAPADGLVRVCGIGPGTARAIRWAVEEPAARYGTTQRVSVPLATGFSIG